jgi:hypothetical protein
MGRPRFHQFTATLSAIIAAIGVILMTGQATATELSQKSRGDYYDHQQQRDERWPRISRDRVDAHHAATEPFVGVQGRIGDSDKPRSWKYGDGGFDSSSFGRSLKC